MDQVVEACRRCGQAKPRQLALRGRAQTRSCPGLAPIAFAELSAALAATRCRARPAAIRESVECLHPAQRAGEWPAPGRSSQAS